MEDSPSPIHRTIRDLKRRKVLRVAAAYGVVAWLLVESSSVVLPALFLPEWTVRLVVILALAGFPITLFLAWAFDITPQGVVRTQAVEERPEEVQALSRRAIDFVIIGVLLAIVVFLLVDPGNRDSDAAERSIAVLPFLDLSEDRDSEYFSDGISEELLNSLVGVDGLRVAARTSSFAFKGTNADIRTIGEELNVDTVLEGSVRRAGDQVRITAQLINVEDGFHLWSQTYNRQMDDIFKVQDEISHAIVDALRLTLIGQADGPMVESVTGNIRAYDLYLLGRHHWHQRTAESLARALELFEQSVELDEEFALAYTGIADSYLLLDGYGDLSSEEAARKAEPAIAKALELDSQLAEAYASLGLLRLNEGEFSAAELALRGAINLNPNYSMAHMWLGLVLQKLSGLRAAHQEFEQALKLDPLHPTINGNLAGTLTAMGRLDEAQARYQRLIDQEPDSDKGYMGMADVALTFGHLDEAVSWSKRALERDGENVYALIMLARAYDALGDFERADGLLSQAQELAPEEQWLISSRMYHHYLRGDVEALVGLARQQLADVAEESSGALDKHSRERLIWPGAALIVGGDDAAGAELLSRAILGDEPTGLKPHDELAVRSLLAAAFRRMDQPARAESVLARAIEIAQDAREQGWAIPQLSSGLASVYLAQNRNTEALAEMRNAVSQGWRDYWSVVRNPLFGGVLESQEYRELLAEVKADIDLMRERLRAAEGPDEEDEVEAVATTARIKN